MKQKKEIKQTTSDIFVGLDIGTTKIATIVGSLTEDEKVRVLGYGVAESTGVEAGSIRNIIKTVSGIKKSIEDAEKRFDYEIQNVYVGVAGKHIRSIEYVHKITRRNGKKETIKQEEIDLMVDDLKNISFNPGEHIIDVIPQRFIVDNNDRYSVDPVGELGQVLTGYFQIVVGNEEEIEKIVDCVKKAELNPQEIVLEPIASGIACLTLEDKKQGVAVVDIGGGTTDIAIFYEGKPVFTRVIPIGGVSITRDIAKLCMISEELAEKLKVLYGTCSVEKSNKNNVINIPQLAGMQPKQLSETYLAQIINARVENDILGSLKKAIEESGFKDKLKHGIVLTGGGAAMKNIIELCQFITNLPVRAGLPVVGFVPEIYSELKKTAYSTSLGLLKYGILSVKHNASVDFPPPPPPIPGRKSFIDILTNFFNNSLEKTS